MNPARKITVGGVKGMILLLALAQASCALAPAPATHTSTETPQATKQQVLAAYGKLPLSFEANAGQADPQVKFLSRGSGYTLFLTPTEAVLTLTKADVHAKRRISGEATLVEPEKRAATVLRMKLLGANPAPPVAGVGELPGKSNYFIGNDSKKVLAYSTFLGGSNDDRGFGIAVDAAGNAYVTGGTGSINFPTTPGAFQTTSGGGDAFVTKLDPTGAALVYSTYLGGSSGDFANGIAVDATGSAYVTGTTVSADFPTTPGAAQTTFGGGLVDAFVTKLNPTGSALVYSTYLGGGGSDQGFGIAVDTAGNAYRTGHGGGVNLPTRPGTFHNTPG